MKGESDKHKCFKHLTFCRKLWRGCVIECYSRSEFECVIEKYCSAGAGSAKDLGVAYDYDLDREDIILLATKFKNLKKLCLDRK